MPLRSLITALILTTLSAVSASAAESIPAKDRVVILITVDGFPAWLWHDPALPVPTLHKLAAEGAVADSMEVVNPSITWICHTTLVTGVGPIQHGVLFNGLLVRPGKDQPPMIDQWRDKAELVRVPTIYDAAHKAGLSTAQVDWVAILNSGTIDHEFLEIPKPDGEIERDLIAAGKVTPADLHNFIKGKSPAWRDMIYNDAAIDILEKHHPNFLLLHYLNTDALNHADGPGSMASYAAYALVDYQIRDLLASLDAAGYKDKATVIITTDHGFKKVKTGIWPNVALRKAGLIEADGAKVKKCDAYTVVEGGLAFVYVPDPAKREALLPKLREICTGIEGVDKVIDGKDAHTIDIPTPTENQGTGDLILTAKPGFAFQAKVDGDAVNGDPKGYYGTHGYLASDPELDGTFIAWGYGIKPGTKLGHIRNRDVAPTIAELLGVPLPNVEGHPLDEMLSLKSSPMNKHSFPRWLCLGTTLFAFATSSLAADITAPLTLSHDKNLLVIHGAQIPGGEIPINYLEAYCRAGSTDADWSKHTVIKHTSSVISQSADGRVYRQRDTLADGVIVDHIVTTDADEVDFHIVAINPTSTASEAQWAQPCVRLSKFTGFDEKTAGSATDYLPKSFVFLDGQLTRMPTPQWATTARYTPGQVWCPANVPRSDVNPRPLNPLVPSNGLIGCFSSDDKMIFAMAFEPYQELFQGVIRCLHSDFRIGGLAPGETKHIHGKIYLVPNDVPALLTRYQKDFPEHTTKP